MVDYELTQEGFYIVTHQSQEIGTTIPINRSAERTKNLNGSYTVKAISGNKTFVDDSDYLQYIELIDNSAEITPNIICRNAVTNVTVYEDYVMLQHPEREWISIDQEKWYIYLFDGVDTWNRLVPDSQTITYKTIDSGYIIKRLLTHGDSTFTISYKLEEGNFAEQGIKIENGSAQDIQIRFALTLEIPAPTFSINEEEEITPDEIETEDNVNIDIDNFKIKVAGILRTWIDISRIKQHIWKWTHQKIDVDKIKLGIITNGFTILSNESLEYWF